MGLGRFMSIYEIGGLQGVPKDWVDELLAAHDVATVGKAFGDAMSLNVLMRLLPVALYSAGLIPEVPKDKWAADNVPKTGCLPSAVYV